MKRILSLILSITLVISLVPAVDVSAAGEFTIRGTNTAVFPGEQVSVDLILENNPGFSAINLYYIFDTSYFRRCFTCTDRINTTAWSCIFKENIRTDENK